MQYLEPLIPLLTNAIGLIFGSVLMHLWLDFREKEKLKKYGIDKKRMK